jgi:hypothetical protein
MLNVTTTVALSGIGVLLFLFGLAAGARRTRNMQPSHIDRFLTRAGIVVLCLGLYAGFRGPLKLGAVTLPRFSFLGRASKTAEQACTYARSNLALSSRPAPGWKGGSRTKLQFTVENRGTRTVSWITLRFRTKMESGRGSVDLKLRGPFRTKQPRKCVLDIPDDVSRAYFEFDNTTIHRIVAARF